MALKLFTMLSFKKEFKKQNERHVQEHSHKETVPIGIKKTAWLRSNCNTHPLSSYLPIKLNPPCYNSMGCVFKK